ncbi:MAG: gliding motility lipoprotein GldD [Spirosomataceae bacterium]
MTKLLSISLIAIFFSSFLLFGCNNSAPEFAPKPKGYNRIDLPEHAYQPLDDSHPYKFEYSKAAIIQPDTFRNAEPHWIIIYYPKLNARVQFTYKPVLNSPQRLQNMINDAFMLASKHHVKAESQEDQVVNLKNGKKAVAIQLEGDVPSHYQFYITDTTTHYLRGAMYLMDASAGDSLRPIIDYVKKDCMHLLETLEWKKKK